MADAADQRTVVYTVGHSNQSLDRFVELLRQHAVDVLVDVRSAPYSRYAPQFGHQMLSTRLPAAGIKYLFLGRELGGRPDEPAFYDPDGHVNYARLARAPRFLSGIERVLTGGRRFRVALMCSEEDPSICHRRLLVGRVLCERGAEVKHIRGDGRIESEADLRRAETPPGGEQLSFLAEPEEATWRSIRSVLRSGQPPTSSAR